MEKTLQDGAAVRFGWQTFKDNVGFLIGAMVLSLIALGILLGISVATGQDSTALSSIFMVLYYIAATIVGIGWIKIALTLVDGGKPSMADLFKHWNLFLKYLGVSILYGLIVLGGTILLVVPGIYWSIKFYFAPMLVVDKGMGPVEALKESARMTDGVKWDLLGFMCVISVVVLIGYVALVIGLVAAAPTAGLAMAYTYRKLQQQSGSAPSQAQAPVQPQAPMA